MTITLTQANLSTPPVSVAVTGLPQVAYPAVVQGIVQRSGDGVRYTTVRGLAEAVVTAGALSTTEDWEFRPQVVNTYRAGCVQQYVDTFSRTVADGWGSADTGQAWDTSSPGVAADVGSGKGTIAHGSASTTYAVYLPDTDVGDVDASVFLSTNLGAAPGGGSVSAGIVARRAGSDYYAADVTVGTDGDVTLGVAYPSDGAFSATPLTYTGSEVYRLRLKVDGPRIRARVWEPAATPEPTTWQIDVTVPVGAPRLTGGQVGLRSVRAVDNTDAGLVWSFGDFTADTGRPTFTQTGATITPGLTSLWLCSTTRSFLNQAPMCVGFQNVSRDGRGGSSYVGGRSLPIGQTELMGARRWEITLRTETLADYRELEYLAASGDVFYVQVPPDCPMPPGYYAVESLKPAGQPHRTSTVRWSVLPLEERAAPGPDVVTATATWATVLAAYGDWPAVVAAHPTGWDSVLGLLGDPSEVVVP